MEYPDLDDSATLAEIDAEIERLERELTDSRCAHETRLLTKRTFANGSVHFVLQSGIAFSHHHGLHIIGVSVV